MDLASVPTDGFNQEISVSIDAGADFQTGSLVFSGSARMERQHIPRLQNTIQVVVPQGAASTRIMVALQIQVFGALSYHQEHQQDMHEFTHSMEHVTLSDFLARLHQRTPVNPDISPADIIRELRDEL